MAKLGYIVNGLFIYRLKIYKSYAVRLYIYYVISALIASSSQFTLTYIIYPFSDPRNKDSMDSIIFRLTRDRFVRSSRSSPTLVGLLRFLLPSS